MMKSQISQLKEMGFSEEVARRALSECVWDVNKAIDKLLLGGLDEVGDSGAVPSMEDTIDAHPAPIEAPPETPAPPAPGPPPPQAQPTHTPALVPVTAQAEMPPTQEVPAQPVPSQSPPQPPSSPARMLAAPAEELAAEEEWALNTDAERQGSSGDSSIVPNASLPANANPSSVEDGVSGHEAGDMDAAPELHAPVIAGPPMMAGSVHIEPPVENDVVAADAALADGGDDEDSKKTPKKRIDRASRSWPAEDPSQLGVEEGDFVSVWIETGTMNGWIHAENLSDGRAGWLPNVVLEPMENDRNWMKVKQTWEAMDASQCNVIEGHIVIVWSSSRTEHWTYVEVREGTQQTGCGWLPVFCIDWDEN